MVSSTEKCCLAGGSLSKSEDLNDKDRLTGEKHTNLFTVFYKAWKPSKGNEDLKMS